MYQPDPTARLERTRDRLAREAIPTRAGIEADRGGSEFVAVEITALANDYLTVKRIDSSGTKVGDTFDVAKPPKLRHVAANYPGVSAISTTDTNSMTVTISSADYDWAIPDEEIYAVGDKLLVAHVSYTGVTVSSADLKWIDCNIDGRAWIEDG